MHFTFITGNSNKVREDEDFLGIPIHHDTIDLPEIQSMDLSEIVQAKAEEAYTLLQSPVLVEDTELIFSAIAPLPGPLIKWFLSSLQPGGLAQLVHNYENTSAIARTTFDLYDGTKHHLFTGECRGTIAPTPRGDKGFGWAGIFIPESSTRTWGEMTTDEKAGTSQRARALVLFREFLDLQPT